MANKKLKGIIWPNLPNDTYLLDSGEVNYDPEETYREGSTGKALQHKAEINGYYSDLTAGNAEQLVSNVRANDKTPYIFRTSGGSVDIGDREYVNGIVGGSVAFNQLVSPTTLVNTSPVAGVTLTANNGVVTLNGTVTSTEDANLQNPQYTPAIVGHKYYVGGANGGAWLRLGGSTSVYDKGNGAIDVAGNVIAGRLAIHFNSGDTFNNVTIKPQLIDLTQRFGSTIADYIYSLEQANAGAGVAWFKKLFPKPYYAYDAGTLKHVEGLVSHDMTGFNQWDEEWENGYIDPDGTLKNNSNYIRSKNYIKALPSTTYYIKASATDVVIAYYDENKKILSMSGFASSHSFATPSNAHFIKFYLNNSTYNHDICINLAWDNSRNGEYEPYELHSYPLDSDLTLRGIPKLDANNNLYYDGDEYLPDGTVNRRYGIVDLGTLTWSYAGSYFFAEGIPYKTESAPNVVANMVCAKYETVAQSVWTNYTTCIAQIQTSGANKQILIKDGAYTDANALKNSLSGVYLVYELGTPTTESADPYQATQIVNDFGTEEYVIDDNAFAIPVGHDTDYPINALSKVEMAPNSPSGDGDYIVRQTNGMNEYVPLVIEDALPTIPSTAGSYKLIVTVAEGSDPVLSWESEA